MISDYWINDELKVFKKNNLVYVSTMKCAHQFYCHVAEKNYWDPFNFKDIDWQKDHVFGFIMDPIELYLKGLAEDLDTDRHIELYKELYNINYSRNIILLTAHSIPPSIRYQEYRYKIDWIPMVSKPNTEYFFKKVCNHHGIDIEIPADVDRHVSSRSKLENYRVLKTMFNNFNGTFYKIFSTDIDFYNTVDVNFNQFGQTWNEISCLKNYASR